MKPPFLIYGFAIVSADGMIADANQVMPQSLKYEADHLFFEKALAEADLILHGRQSHEGHTESSLRRRFWLTHSVAKLEPDPAGDSQWLWNPAGISLEEAGPSIGLDSGIVAILGGTSVYDIFLPNYDIFHLSRAGNARIPGGTPVFSAVAQGETPQDVLKRHNMVAEPAVTLDARNDVTMTRWVRHA